MKIIHGLFLCLCFAGAVRGQILLGTDIAVNISVEVENAQLKETVYRNMTKNLRTLNTNIVVVEGEGSYLVKIQMMKIKSSPAAESGYAFSTVVTAKEYATRRNKPAEM